MFRSIMLAALMGVLFVTSYATTARPAMTRAANDAASVVSHASETVIDDDGPGLGGGY